MCNHPRGTVVGKTGKIIVLPGFWGIYRGNGSGDAPLSQRFMVVSPARIPKGVPVIEPDVLSYHVWIKQYVQ